VIRPRPYQAEALDALDDHMRAKTTNPCVVIPTGGGKSLIIAWAIQRWANDYPPFRCMILAHRKELVEQNSEELKRLWPAGDVGVYSAGLGRRDIDASIVFASIDSVAKRAGEFPAFDVVLVDEAHRIPARGEGKYRSFIADCKQFNPSLRVVGFTATPYRMGMGAICHKDHILNEICYEASISSLIEDGFLCRLRSKAGEAPNLSGVRRNGRGDYVQKALAEAVDTPAVVQKAVQNAMAIIRAEQRRSVIFFCVDVKHAADVSRELAKWNVHAPTVTGKTKKAERKRIAEGFKAGQFQALVNVNVYTEGFNARRVDCVVLLRPTLSAGLYAQMVGRGLRLHPCKVDCLVLDFSRCIETHGPIDCIEAGEVRLIVCGSVASKRCEDCEAGTGKCEGCSCLRCSPGCGDVFSRALRACPHCGWKIPPQEIERAEAEETERKMHEAEAAQRSILGSEPEELEVSAVTIHRHKKQGKPDSLRVQYRCGLSTFREWVCLDHEGLAGRKARRWWADRFGVEEAKLASVDRVLGVMFNEAALTNRTEAITVVRRGKYSEIVGHKIRASAEHAS